MRWVTMTRVRVEPGFEWWGICKAVNVLAAKSYRFLVTTANSHSILAGPEPLAAPQGRGQYIVSASEASVGEPRIYCQ